MSYLFLLVAIVLELVGTAFIKYSKGFTVLLPTVSCIAIYIICFFCFSKALLKLNLGIAYATWCGAGIVASTLMSIFIFKETISAIGVIGIILIIAGCIILNVFGTVH
ncbi:QacE family quaternary ammonium compound efflux SMR transporter [Clostridium botulinum]|nr:QacE family quaternary ammonium compound efflux SMR transporter [Clostridium botulinum]NFT06275.1 QacE family quaternary ammonium compound efflux SMR transporter [Clostridium botulinum]